MNLKFDDIAGEFDTQRGLPRQAIQAWMGLIDELNEKPVLEIVEPGIGTGRIALPLAMLGHQVTGADISVPMLNTCAAAADEMALGEQVSLLLASADDLPLADQSFDIGIVAQLLYLVPDWPVVLDELARLVTPGGFVIHLTEPTTQSEVLIRWSASWRQFIEDTGYQHTESVPSDEDVRAEFARRWPDVEVRELATWTFGQTVAEALTDYGTRLRPLYESVSDDDWNLATERFLAWAAEDFPDQSTRLDGTVTLTALIAAV